MYHNVHVLILSDMYIHVHTCVHIHTYVVFICTYVYRYIYVCTHMYTLTHVLFFCMYIQVNTAGHIWDDQQIHFVWYKRDFESRELVLSDARVNYFLLAIFIWPCLQTFRTGSSTPWNQILGSTCHGRWCTFTRRWDQVQMQLNTNIHLSGRISEYGMMYIDIYAYVYTYRYTYRYI